MKKLIKIVIPIFLFFLIIWGCEKAVNFQYNVDSSSCNSCSRCIQVCPVDAVEIGLNGKAVIDQTKCNQCGQCITVCPKNAIY
ncbi:MAG TPA: 4Fe-4S dicluster domain-containing protein [Candidatus Cloacimonetes bacterium]|nr:4Fe-4S dicluster domain-containing protein [Candidatus Cloacimonadota bacterium]